ncbi:MAG: sigma-E processing peptidase SpoIIGA [Defluviitaleaceae bacterium]|nr:sigma-E processing peptidase SpoIIGA [Defluviitaleaceae bacterium]
MDIYIDIIFFINLMMNFIIFFTVSKISKTNKNFFRIFLGSATSALLYCIFLVFLQNIFNIFTAIFILISGLFVSFGKIFIKRFVFFLIYSHLIAFLIGGMATAIYNYTNISLNTVFSIIRHFNINILFTSTIISYISIYFANRYFQKIKMTKKSFCKVEIFKDNKSVSFTALIDTGNSLVDPLNQCPVIIAEQKIVNKIFNINNIDENKGFEKIRLIPYKTIGNEGILTGFSPDKVIIINNKQPIETTDVVIGLCDFNLSRKGLYQGLLNPSFLEQTA